jgi:hypothetical protein
MLSEAPNVSPKSKRYTPFFKSCQNYMFLLKNFDSSIFFEVLKAYHLRTDS